MTSKFALRVFEHRVLARYTRNWRRQRARRCLRFSHPFGDVRLRATPAGTLPAPLRTSPAAP
eukprot:2847907-Lingulodinium_polyedra.AAC.1